MINFPCAKINLGLNIIERRPDGYHNLQTVFFPIPIKDVLEIHKMDDNFPSATACDLKVTGNSVCCNETEKLITYWPLTISYRVYTPIFISIYPRKLVLVEDQATPLSCFDF